MQDLSIKNTTKSQRIELIKSWQPADEVFDENNLDIWEIYRDYIDGKKEIAECNAEFSKGIKFCTDEDN